MQAMVIVSHLAGSVRGTCPTFVNPSFSFMPVSGQSNQQRTGQYFIRWVDLPGRYAALLPWYQSGHQSLIYLHRVWNINLDMSNQLLECLVYCCCCCIVMHLYDKLN